MEAQSDWSVGQGQCLRATQEPEGGRTCQEQAGSVAEQGGVKPAGSQGPVCGRGRCYVAIRLSRDVGTTP